MPLSEQLCPKDARKLTGHAATISLPFLNGCKVHDARSLSAKSKDLPGGRPQMRKAKAFQHLDHLALDVDL